MKNFKTTVKEYKTNYKIYINLQKDIDRARYQNDIDLVVLKEKEVKTLEENYFNLVNKNYLIHVSYSIGYRSYYEDAVKIGKTILKNGEALNKTNGFTSVKEIEQITDTMKKEMESDIYYY